MSSLLTQHRSLGSIAEVVAAYAVIQLLAEGVTARTGTLRVGVVDGETLLFDGV